MATFVLLKLHKITMTAAERQFERVVLAVAESKLDKDGMAKFLQKHSRRGRL